MGQANITGRSSSSRFSDKELRRFNWFQRV
jgi:hypothetical protein